MRPFSVLALFLAACAPSAVLPAGTEVPVLATDPVLLAQVEASDGVGPQIWLTHGFSRGEPIAYWDLGPVAVETAMPVYVLCRPSGSTCAPIDHPRVAVDLPGGADYSPYSWVHEVAVTAAYAGQILPSVAAIDEAVAAGLVEAPEPTLFYLELPIVHPDTTIELGPDDWASPNATVYVDGIAAPAIDFSLTHPRLRLENPNTGLLLHRNVYVLTREGETQPIVERMRGVDLTGDGDQSDSNNIVGAPLSATDYTPLWTVVLVTVPADYASIDDAMDQTIADYRSATDMFTIATDYSITPIEGQVVDFSMGSNWVNCPVQSAPGML